MGKILNCFFDKMVGFVEWIHGFFPQFLQGESSKLVEALKWLSYGQVALLFSFILENTEPFTFYLLIYTFLFPIFFVLGCFFGVMGSAKNRDSKYFSILLVYFSFFTLLNCLVSTAYFFGINIFLGFALVLSFIVIMNLIGMALRIKHRIEPPK